MSAWYRTCVFCGGPFTTGAHEFQCWWAKWLRAAQRAPHGTALVFAPMRDALDDGPPPIPSDDMTARTKPITRAELIEPSAVDGFIKSNFWIHVKAGQTVYSYDPNNPDACAPLKRPLVLGESVITSWGIGEITKVDGDEAVAQTGDVTCYLEFGKDSDLEWTVRYAVCGKGWS